MPDNRSLLITNAEVIVTMDETRRELRGASLRVQGRQIEAIWPAVEMPPGTTANEVIDARGHAVLPGLVNTHHHMYQSLTRAIPAAQNAELLGWLKTLYPIWAGLTPEMVRVSTQLAMAELLLSGCTTVPSAPDPWCPCGLATPARPAIGAPGPGGLREPRV